MLLRRADRKNISIKYRTGPRDPWQWGSSGEMTRKQARKVAPALIEKWLADTKRTCDDWRSFRERYESEHLAGGKEKTAEAFRTAANRLEALAPVRSVQDLDEATFVRFSSKLHKAGASTATRQAYRDHLLSALKWAVHMKIIDRKPSPPPITGTASKARGRALQREEAERIAMKLPGIVGASNSEKWAWNLEALWQSGFRIGETFAFTWDESEFHYVYELDSSRPMIAIAAAHEKGGQVRLLPMAPDFAELLRAVPVRLRRGQVFRWPGKRGGEVSVSTVEKRIAKAGELAGVIVGANSRGDPRYAAAHDWRRSFGARWAPRVMPAILQVLMRHQSIKTTMSFYVGENARRNADALWLSVAADTDFGANLGATLDALYSVHETDSTIEPAKRGEN